jgi:hypothetical protein
MFTDSLWGNLSFHLFLKSIIYGVNAAFSHSIYQGCNDTKPCSLKAPLSAMDFKSQVFILRQVNVSFSVYSYGNYLCLRSECKDFAVTIVKRIGKENYPG